MIIEIGPCAAYLLRHTLSGALLICDGAGMVQEIAAAIAASARDGFLPYTVDEMQRSLRWRRLPKKDIRALAQAALNNEQITPGDYESIEAVYK